MSLHLPEFDPHLTSPAEIRALYGELYEQGCPVVQSDAHGGFFTVTSHAELRRAAGDWELFSSEGGITLPKQPFKTLGIENDPPEHTYWRAVFAEVLSFKAVRAVEDSVRGDAVAMIGQFAGRGHADLVEELASAIPGNTICRLIGVTEPDRIRLGCRLGLTLVETTFDREAQQRAVEPFAAFCMEEVGARRALPRGDYLSRLANEDISGHRLSDQEIVSVLVGFFFAGHHTTTAGLASLFHTLSTDRAVRDALLAQPSLIPRAAEEAVRLETPLHGFFRQTTADVEVQGCPIPAGSEVWLNYAAGNRDPAVFERAEDFVLDRKVNPHLGFGFGIHSCVGAALARMEMRVVTEELLRRLPDLESSGEPLEHRWGGGNIMSIARVPVRFTPVPPTLQESQ